jgi:hypothetical protein
MSLEERRDGSGESLQSFAMPKFFTPQTEVRRLISRIKILAD